MSFWSRMGAAWRGLKSSGETSPYGGLAAFLEVYGSRASKSGETVNWQTALQVSTVAAVTRVLCDGIAQIPLRLHRERADGKGSDPATDHPLYHVLYRRPNPWQTSFGFRETMMLHLILCSNFFALKGTVGRAAELRELIPIEPGRVDVEQLPDMSLRYWVRSARGERREMPPGSIWHVRGPSWNSWMGMEAVKVARESIGLSMAIEGDQSKLYKNGLRTSGTYSVEGTLTPQQYKDLRAFIKEFQADEGGGPLILDHAAKYLQQTMSGVDAQTLESRKFQVEEVCRPFRVMPLMVGHPADMAARAATESIFIAHVVHTLAPWCSRIEQAIDNDLLDADRDANVYAKFNLNGLMRGAFKERMEGYARMLGAGGSPPMAEVNELRAMEEMNPVDWGDGKPEPPQSAPTTPPDDKPDPPEGDV